MSSEPSPAAAGAAGSSSPGATGGDVDGGGYGGGSPLVNDAEVLAYLEEQARLAEEEAARPMPFGDGGASGLGGTAAMDASADGGGPGMSSLGGDHDDAAAAGAAAGDDGAGADPHGASAAWHNMNQLLREAHVTPVQLVVGTDGDAAAKEGSVLAAMRELLVAFRRRGDTIQELSNDAAGDAGGAAGGGAAGDGDANALLQRRLAAMQARATQAEESLAAVRKHASSDVRALKQSNAQLKRVISQLEHRGKAQEADAQRMRARLEQEANKHRDSVARTRKMFRKIHSRDPRPASAADTKVLMVVNAYEDQRAAMARELDFLRSEVRRLNDEVRDRENFIAEKSRSNQWHMRTASQAKEAARLETAKRELDSRNAALSASEMLLEEERIRFEAEMREKTAYTEDLLEELANLRLEVDARPTQRDWKDAQRRVRSLEHKVAAAVDMGVPLEEMNRRADAEEREAASVRAHSSTGALMQRDKAAHKLQLHRLDALPHTTALDILRDVCIELNVGDPAAIGASLRKIKRVVAVVPALEAFCKDVVTFVLMRSGAGADGDGVGASGDDGAGVDGVGGGSAMRQVMPALQRWAREVRRARDLVDATTRIAAAMAQRKYAADRDGADAAAADAASAAAASGSGVPGPLDVAALARGVEELVALEAGVLQSKEAFDAATEAMKADPAALPNRITSHFMKLFDVPDLEAVFPRMNQLFLYSNEMTNFQTVLRSMLGITEPATVPALLAAVRQALRERGQGGAPRGAGAGGVPERFERVVPVAGEAAPDAAGAGARGAGGAVAPAGALVVGPSGPAAPDDVWADSDAERGGGGGGGGDGNYVVMQRQERRARDDRGKVTDVPVPVEAAAGPTAGGVHESRAGLAWTVPD